MTSSAAIGALSSWLAPSGVTAHPPDRSFALLGRDGGVDAAAEFVAADDGEAVHLFRRDGWIRLNPFRDDHQEVGLRVADETHDAVGLALLIGGSQLIRVVAQQVLEIELALGVELLELHLGAFAEAALDRRPVQPQLVADPDVDASAGHPGAGPGADV